MEHFVIGGPLQNQLSSGVSEVARLAVDKQAVAWLDLQQIFLAAVSNEIRTNSYGNLSSKIRFRR